MRVIVAGDFAPGLRLEKQVDSRNFREIFSQEIVDFVTKADYALVNLECPVASEKDSPILKCGRNMRCSANAVDAIKYAGFSAATLANNHILDFGSAGIKNTLKCCRAVGLDTVGAGSNLAEAGNVLYARISGKTLAVVNCCEHEYSIATDTSEGANPLNPIRQFYAIKEARGNADYVLVIIHGGHEHYKLPSPRMQETYRFFISVGADAVVNHHQHCHSGYEVYEGKPIFYGLGNFCFDEKKSVNREYFTHGYFAEIDFSEKISFGIHPYVQYAGTPNVQLLPKNAFDEDIKELNRKIQDPKALKKAYEEYCSASERSMELRVDPVQNRWIKSAQCRNLFPRMSSKALCMNLFNLVHCEAHRDKLLYYLRKRIGI